MMKITEGFSGEKNNVAERYPERSQEFERRVKAVNGLTTNLIRDNRLIQPQK